VALAEEETNTAVGQNALLHGETLLVVASGDSEDVALPLVAKGGGVDLHAHSLLIERPDLKKQNLIRVNRALDLI